MANMLFDKSRELFLTGQLNWLTDDFKCFLLDTSTGFTPSGTAHSWLSDIPNSAVRVTVPISLASKTATGGAADAADVTFTSVTGAQAEGIVIYKLGTLETNSPLVAYIDIATGLPITPNGGDIIITWDNGPNKIFKL